MNCKRLQRHARPTNWWHRLWCVPCRASYGTDLDIARELARLRREPPKGVNSVLEAVDLAALGRSRKRIAWRVGRFSLARKGVVVGLLGGWWVWANLEPDLHIPNPVMPSPNARDYYIKAAEWVKDSSYIFQDSDIQDKDFLQRYKKAQQDWAAFHNKHSRRMGPGKGVTLIVRQANQAEADRIGRQSAMFSQERALLPNKPALAKLREGFAYPYKELPSRSFAATFPYHAKYRELATVLHGEMMLRIEQEDWNAAMQCCLDTLQMGEEMAHGSPLIGPQRGRGCQSRALRFAWQVVPHLTAEEAAQAARRLEAILARHVSLAETFQEEKWAGQAGLLEILRKPDFFAGLTTAPSEFGDDWWGKTVRVAVSQGILLYYSKRRILDNYTRYWDQVIADARLPYIEKRPEPPVPTDPISRILISTYPNEKYAIAANEAQNDLLLVTLALQAYSEDMGYYPETLEELVPTYLQKLPNDPFARSGSFQYRLVEDEPLLYSIGPDGRDDHGRAIDFTLRYVRKNAPPNPQDGSRHLVQPSSQGDIVAGLNH